MDASIYYRPDIYDIHFSEKKEELLREHYNDIFKNKDIKTVHDCSYGTGNMTNVLSKMGYIVTGSDISEMMLQQAQVKNIKEKLDILLKQSDFRELSNNING
jgi:2-polyprenyl-3-methyl-5-hydroxy-6-metoxy-1,4-benzoquinol methylase